MKKLIFTSLILCSIAFVSSPTQACGLDDPYIGPNGTSCAYIRPDGCWVKVTNHRILFGLIRWKTEEVTHCPQTKIQDEDTSVVD